MFRNKMLVLVLAALAAVTALLPLAAGGADYVIQPEDVLAIKVSGEPGLSKDYMVSERGEITLDMVGKIKAAGMTAKQLREALTLELGKYLKIFEVTIQVQMETGSRVLVFGEVAKAGSVKLRPGGKLLDALAEAGQPTMNADVRRISISKKSGGEPVIVDLEAVSRDPALNLDLEPGDTIQVPSKAANTVRVDGEVTNPGNRSIDEARTAYQAVMSAVPTPKADFSRVVLRRKGSDTPLTVDLSKVRTGMLKDDLKLEPGDQLTIMSKFAGFATLRGAVTSPGEKELNGTTQLWDFITGPGGGFATGADQIRVQIVRGGRTEKTINLLEVARGIRRSDDPELEVRPGDVIFVPTAIATLRGEVVKQGEQPIGSSSNILDFIMSSGGGFTDKADRSSIRVIRDGKVVRTVDITAVENGKKSYDDPELQVLPGDIIHVPNDEKNRFVIVGGVKKPGAHLARPGMTILDALNMADGFSDRASRKALVVAPAGRFDEKGNLRLAEPPNRKPEKKKRDNKKPEAAAGTEGAAKPEDEKRPDLEQNPDFDPKKAEEIGKEYGLIVVDLKKLQKGDPKQIVAINPGDRIFVPEEPPADMRQRKPGFFESILRMVPLAGYFFTGGIGY
jgi:protein involved in polysaccharide export with SLBB domain